MDSHEPETPDPRRARNDRAPDGPDGAPRTAQVTESWSGDRGYLLATATRILGDADSAEEVVAEAYARLVAQTAPVRDARGWLVVVVRRIALDRLGSAHRRLCEPTDPTEAVLDRTARSTESDPADRITLDDEIRRALTVVLDRLSPGERATFLLHDVFGLRFDEVGLLVGRSPAACRQLASRARRAIRTSGPQDSAPTPPPSAHLDRVAERFVAACDQGDVDGLAALLRQDVSGWAIRDGVVLSELHGLHQVSTRATAFFGPRSSWEMVALGAGIGPPGTAAVLVLDQDSPAGLITLMTDDDDLISGLQATLLSRASPAITATTSLSRRTETQPSTGRQPRQ